MLCQRSAERRLYECAGCGGSGEDQLRGGIRAVVAEAQVPAVEVDEEIGEDEDADQDGG